MADSNPDADLLETIFEIYDKVGQKWHNRVVVALKGGRLRFSELKRELDGSTQRMLTRTLRSLERDGLVRRSVIDSAQSHVEYELTELGRSSLGLIEHINAWITDHYQEISLARSVFDAKRER